MNGPDRTCIACGVTAPAEWKSGLKVVIVSLSVVVFRRMQHRQLKTTKTLHICEPCLLKAIRARGDCEEGRILAEAITGRIAERYNTMKGGR